MPLVAKHIEGTNRVRNDRSRTRRTHEVPFIVACSHFTQENTRFRAPASSPKHRPCNIHAAITMRSATTASELHHRNNQTHRRNQSRPERPQPHPSHTRGTFHRRHLQPQLQETHRTTPQEQPLVAKHIEGTNRVRNDRSRTRRRHVHRRLQPLYTQKHKVSFSGVLPKT